MKAPYYLLASALCIAVIMGACSDAPTDVADEAALSVEAATADAVAKKDRKVDICHWDENGWDDLPAQTEPGAFFHLNVSNNSWGEGGKKNPNGKDVGHNGHPKDQWYCFPGDNVDNDEEACTPESDREKATIDPGDQNNAVFCEEDGDGDSFSDDSDNCPEDANNDQANNDGDSHGDACDNCPVDDNEGQEDNDADGIGDACDACPNDPDNDSDADGVCGDIDNCPDDFNPTQPDVDLDFIGDACDDCTDVDGDGYCAEVDDCDDLDGDVNPGETELCGNGIDDDCDELVDIDDTECID